MLLFRAPFTFDFLDNDDDFVDKSVMWAEVSSPPLSTSLMLRRADTLLDRLIISFVVESMAIQPLHIHMKSPAWCVGGRLPAKSEGVLRRTSEMVNSEYDNATKQRQKNKTVETKLSKGGYLNKT